MNQYDIFIIKFLDLIDAQDEDGNTAILLAVDYNFPELIRVLVIEGKAKIDILNNLKMAPVHYAVEQSRAECLKVYLL